MRKSKKKVVVYSSSEEEVEEIEERNIQLVVYQGHNQEEDKLVTKKSRVKKASK
ncbi:hypothetical protein MKX03_002694, partial [Papaver bracteatum]